MGHRMQHLALTDFNRFSQQSDMGDCKRKPITELSNSKVRRCLFGYCSDDERAESVKFANDQLNLTLHESAVEWNFDFEKDQPLTGRYQWEKINPETSSSTLTLKSKCQNPNVPLSASKKENVISIYPGVKFQKLKATFASVVQSKMVQTTIIDFTQHRKRQSIQKSRGPLKRKCST